MSNPEPIAYKSEPPKPQSGPPNFSLLIVIAVLAVICVALAFVLLMKANVPAAEESKKETTPPPPPIFNRDSAELAELRDSLSNAAGASQGGALVAAVSLDRMNVFYIGVDNPVSIAVSGVDPSLLSVSIAGGSMSPNGKPGSYIVRVTSGTKATINVSVNENGTTRYISSYEYRIKRVPDPVAYVSNVKGDGQMSKAEINAATGVFARMENFDFDLSYSVVSFVMTININGVYVEKKGNGPAITAEMKTLLASVKPGNIVLFNQITVQGPDGTLRKIPGVMIKVK